MQMTIQMPQVRMCDVTDCAYNTDEQCHARAITVGDGSHPRCDTFLRSHKHVDSSGGGPGVGACKVSSCRFNAGLECNAELIEIGRHRRHAECLTFAAP